MMLLGMMLRCRNVRMKRLLMFVFFAFLLVILFYKYSPFARKGNVVNTKKLLAAGIDLLEEAGKRIVEIKKSPYMNIQQKTVGINNISVELLTTADITSHKIIHYGLTSTFPGLKVISEEHTKDDETIVYLPNMDRIKLPELSGGEEIPISDLSVWIDPLDATQEYTENLTEYVTIMMCVVRKNEPIIGIIYKPFERKLYWAYKSNKLSYFTWPQRNSSKAGHMSRIIVSRSHGGNVSKTIQDKFGNEYETLKAGGSGYKTIEILEGRAEVYLHKTIIKKWDTCAPDALLRISGSKMTDLRGLPIEYSDPKEFVNFHGLLASRNRQNEHDILLERLNW